MLITFNKIDETLIEKLLKIYKESLDNGFFGEKSDFVDDIYASFKRNDFQLFGWEFSGEIVSCVRIETTENSALLYSLETAPEFRKKGCANALVKAVVDHLTANGVETVVAHINKRNKTSLKLHQNVGFKIVRDSAKLLDGTVSQNYYTLEYKK